MRVFSHAQDRKFKPCEQVTSPFMFQPACFALIFYGVEK